MCILCVCRAYTRTTRIIIVVVEHQQPLGYDPTFIGSSKHNCQRTLSIYYLKKVVFISHCAVCSVTICFSTSSQLEENVTVQVAGNTFNFYFN